MSSTRATAAGVTRARLVRLGNTGDRGRWCSRLARAPKRDEVCEGEAGAETARHAGMEGNSFRLSAVIVGTRARCGRNLAIIARVVSSAFAASRTQGVTAPRQSRVWGRKTMRSALAIAGSAVPKSHPQGASLAHKCGMPRKDRLHTAFQLAIPGGCLP